MGDCVIIEAGWGGKGGMTGQDFKRFNKDTPAIITDEAVSSDIWVRPDGDVHKWKVPKRALKYGTNDRVKDATGSETKLLAAIERAKKREYSARGAVGMAEEARKNKGQRIQSSREQKARSKLSEVQREVYRAEQALKDFKATAQDSGFVKRQRLHRALDAALDAQRANRRK